MPRVLITGCNGFIGSHLEPALKNRGWQVLTLRRDRALDSALDISPNDSVTQCARALEGVDAVVHLAGIAHRQASQADYLTINTDWPARLFEGAAAAGVRRFVQMSSIKVLGDTSEAPLRVNDPYQCSDAYANSKKLAEERLLDHSNSSLNATILRSPLVYGPRVKANFAALLKLAALGRRGLPLPLGHATAPRSLVSTTNLCSLIAKLLESEAGIYHVRDHRDWNVVELLENWQVPPHRLWRLPVPLVRFAASLAGRRGDFEKLFSALQVDQSATLAAVNWRPERNAAKHLDETFAWFLSNR